MRIILLGTLMILSFVSSSKVAVSKINNDQANVPFKNCRDKSGATPGDIEALRNRKLPQTKSGKCFLECIFESVKILDDGKFNKKAMVVVFTPALKGDISKLGKLNELSEICAKEIGPDSIPNCEGATRVVKCVANHGRDYGITFPKAKI